VPATQLRIRLPCAAPLNSTLGRRPRCIEFMSHPLLSCQQHLSANTHCGLGRGSAGRSSLLHPVLPLLLRAPCLPRLRLPLATFLLGSSGRPHCLAPRGNSALLPSLLPVANATSISFSAFSGAVLRSACSWRSPALRWAKDLLAALPARFGAPGVSLLPPPPLLVCSFSGQHRRLTLRSRGRRAGRAASHRASVRGAPHLGR
jgi:hypothetical protein